MLKIIDKAYAGLSFYRTIWYDYRIGRKSPGISVNDCITSMNERKYKYFFSEYGFVYIYSTESMYVIVYTYSISKYTDIFLIYFLERNFTFFSFQRLFNFNTD